MQNFFCLLFGGLVLLSDFSAPPSNISKVSFKSEYSRPRSCQFMLIITFTRLFPLANPFFVSFFLSPRPRLFFQPSASFDLLPGRYIKLSKLSSFRLCTVFPLMNRGSLSPLSLFHRDHFPPGPDQITYAASRSSGALFETICYDGFSFTFSASCQRFFFRNSTPHSALLTRRKGPT